MKELLMKEFSFSYMIDHVENSAATRRIGLFNVVCVELFFSFFFRSVLFIEKTKARYSESFYNDKPFDKKAPLEQTSYERSFRQYQALSIGHPIIYIETNYQVLEDERSSTGETSVFPMCFQCV